MWFDGKTAVRLCVTEAHIISWRTTTREYLLNWNRDELQHYMANNIEKLYFHDQERLRCRMRNCNCEFVLFSAVGQIYIDEKKLRIYFGLLSHSISTKTTYSHICQIFVSQDPRRFMLYMLKHRELRPVNIQHHKTIKESIGMEEDDDDDNNSIFAPASLQFICMESVYRHKLTYDDVPVILRQDLDRFNWMKSRHFSYI